MWVIFVAMHLLVTTIDGDYFIVYDWRYGDLMVNHKLSTVKITWLDPPLGFNGLQVSCSISSTEASREFGPICVVVEIR